MYIPSPPPLNQFIINNQKTYRAHYSLHIQESPPVSGKNHLVRTGHKLVRFDDESEFVSKRIQIAAHFHSGVDCGKGSMIFMDHENALTHTNTLVQFGGVPVSENRSNISYACDDIWYLILPSHYNNVTCHIQWCKLQIPNHPHNSENKAEKSDSASLAYSKKLQRIFVMTYFNKIHTLCLKTLTWDIIRISLPCSYANCLYNHLDLYLLISYCRGQDETHFVQVDFNHIEKSLNEKSTPAMVEFKELDCTIHREVTRGKFLAVPNFSILSSSAKDIDTTKNSTQQDFNFYICGGINSATSMVSEIESIYRVNACNQSEIAKDIHLDSELLSDSRTNHFMTVIPHSSTQVFASNQEEEFSHGHHHALLITFFHKPSKSILFYEYDITANYNDVEIGNSITFGSHLYNYKYGTLKRLVHNKIPIQLVVSNAVLQSSLRPFLHCYVNEKEGRRIAVFVANNRMFYFLNLDYMNPIYCFRMSCPDLIKFCDITVRTRVNYCESTCNDRVELNEIPKQAQAPLGHTENGSQGRKRKFTNRNGHCELQ
ncbi:hypothetical protein FDP41_010743 [Naegleria fowleri]|uniref:Uncharacterized protein n=1 Tax=Naegleria fowleri TaxID=5763 RepID=A0A6A5C8C8_NAEFO|nr:uncharacterized protein FDP41_010743 [Naegleria fowleri]KAF0982764.1 hypothetical protein FDP41_010743 [Naegleria fowleri]